MLYNYINVTINQTSFIFASLYGPNNDDQSFCHNFLSLLRDTTNIIIAGDLNTVISPKWTAQTYKITQKNCHTTDIIKLYMDHFGLGDSWRLSNPSSRGYTYFSSHHQSFSKIDFILRSNSLTQQITETTIHPILINDHAPISLTQSIECNIKPFKNGTLINFNNPPRPRFCKFH